MQERAENFGITFRLDICGLYKVCQGVQVIAVAWACIAVYIIVYTVCKWPWHHLPIWFELWSMDHHYICSHLCSFLVYSIENIASLCCLILMLMYVLTGCCWTETSREEIQSSFEAVWTVQGWFLLTNYGQIHPYVSWLVFIHTVDTVLHLTYHWELFPGGEEHGASSVPSSGRFV